MQVTIRPLQEEDAYTSVKWRNDPEVFKYTGTIYKNEIKIESELQWINKVIANNNEGKDYRCAIIVDSIYVGNIYLTGIHDGSAEYQIFIGNKRFWGKGVAKQASNLILEYAFSTLNLNSLYLKVRKANESACHLYSKLGFKETEIGEEWVKMVIFSNK